VTTIAFTWHGPAGGATFVDVAAHELRGAVLNGQPLDVGADLHGRRLTLVPHAGANELVVDAVMAYSHDGEGLHRHVDPADGLTYLYAMSFLDAAPRWFACFDQPDLKAPVSLDVRCPAGWTVAGNGPAAEQAPGRWQVAATGSLAPYFTTVVAGPYHSVRDQHDGIPLVLHARRSLAEHLDREAPELFAHTRHDLDALHALFGVRYPWGEYHQAFVPEFNAGAMENPGCVTLRDSLVFRSRVTDNDRLDRAVTIAHEMAHMWFGDLVTMRWWDDLWLNESFAEYLGHRVVGEQSWIGFGIARKAWGYRADRRPSTHPVAGNGAADAAAALSEFDGISYAKGASALRQLAGYLGDDVFLDGLRRYVAGHANGNAEFADLADAWTRAGAVDLDTWTQAWLRTTGLDDLSARDGVLTRRSAGNSPRPHAVTVAAFDLDGVLLGTQAVQADTDVTPVRLPAGAVVLPDAHDETWAKLVLPDGDWRGMPTVLPGLADPRSRVAVWNALRLAVADAELDPARAVDLVITVLPAEPDDAVLAVVGRWARRDLAGCYLPDDRRGAVLDRLAAAMQTVSAAAEPGSGRQLAAARLAVTMSTGPAALRAWLDGAGLPPGLVVDAELRWAALTRLAQLGALTPAEIDDEAARDQSSHGAVHAARCRAARPDPAAKSAAWAVLVGDAGRPNYELYATAEGFWEPDQRALTDPYVERYATEIGATATLRSGFVVDRLAALTYPWCAVDPATLAATDRLLADPDLDAGIRRSVIDAGDDLRRAVAVRARFA
jgi:aminopeptidase N